MRDIASGLHLDDALAIEEAEGLELAMERRALHADERRRPGYVAAEPGDLRDQVFPLEDLAGVAKRQAHDLAALVPADHRGRIRADLRRQHLGPHGLADIARRHDQEPVDDVPQLARIAGPVV